MQIYWNNMHTYIVLITRVICTEILIVYKFIRFIKSEIKARIPKAETKFNCTIYVYYQLIIQVVDIYIWHINSVKVILDVRVKNCIAIIFLYVI